MAASSQLNGPSYEFAGFCLVPTERLLLHDGQNVPLPPKVFDTLLLLVENSGRLVDKDTLLTQLWPGTFVEEGTLARNISDLRKALDERAPEHKYIETVPKRGYRFIAEVRTVPDEEAAMILEKRTRAHLVIEQETTLAQEEVGHLSEPQLPVALDHNAPWTARRRVIVFLIAFGLVALAATLAGRGFFWPSKPKEVHSISAVRSIAVLPFKSINEQERDEALELAMADALITRLSNVHQMVVRPTGAVAKFMNQSPDPASAGRELKVDAVLDGSIQRSGERIRVTVQLVRVSDGAPIWAEKLDEKFTDVFGVQDSISERLVRSLALNLSDEEKQRLTKRNTENTEAYQLYVRGRYFWNQRTEEGLKKAIDYFERAIRLDPDYAMAYAGLADCYNVLTSLSLVRPQEANAKVEAAARRALEIDDALPEAHASLGWVRFEQWDWSGAEREFKRAIELNSNYATAHHWYAEYLTAMGRFDEALEEIRRAQQIDPLSLVINMVAGQTYYYARRYDEAIEQCRKTLELDPQFDLAHDRMGMALLQKGMYQEAIAEYRKAKRFDGTPRMLEFIGSAYAISGKRGEARKELQVLLTMSKQKYVSPVFIARLYTNLGQRDEAFEWLDEAVREHSPRLAWLKVDPHFDKLRPDPRFAVVLKRIGLTS